jgi:hypothetical protein
MKSSTKILVGIDNLFLLLLLIARSLLGTPPCRHFAPQYSLPRRQGMMKSTPFEGSQTAMHFDISHIVHSPKKDGASSAPDGNSQTPVVSILFTPQ